MDDKFNSIQTEMRKWSICLLSIVLMYNTSLFAQQEIGLQSGMINSGLNSFISNDFYNIKNTRDNAIITSISYTKPIKNNQKIGFQLDYIERVKLTQKVENLNGNTFFLDSMSYSFSRLVGHFLYEKRIISNKRKVDFDLVLSISYAKLLARDNYGYQTYSSAISKIDSSGNFTEKDTIMRTEFRQEGVIKKSSLSANLGLRLGYAISDELVVILTPIYWFGFSTTRSIGHYSRSIEPHSYLRNVSLQLGLKYKLKGKEN